MSQKFVIDININDSRTFEQQDNVRTQETQEIIQKKLTKPETPKSFIKPITGAAIAGGWKAANTLNEVSNYTSGDTLANERRAMTMKLATYSSILIAAGPKAPIVAAGLAINEVVNAGIGIYKYNVDRRLERSELINVEVLVGDLTYGRRGGKR